MTDILIPARPAIAPADETVQWKRPLGPELAAMADTVNCLAWYHGRRFVSCIPQYSSILDPLINQDPAGVSATHDLVWRSHPKATYAWAIIIYHAEPRPSSGNTRIDATLYDHDTGVAMDGTPGVRWDWAEGTLPAEERLVSYDSGAGASVYEWGYQMVTTGNRTVDSPASTPTPPRCFNISTAAGGLTRLSLTVTNARVIAAFAGDAWRDVLSV